MKKIKQATFYDPDIFIFSSRENKAVSHKSFITRDIHHRKSSAIFSCELLYHSKQMGCCFRFFSRCANCSCFSKIVAPSELEKELHVYFKTDSLSMARILITVVKFLRFHLPGTLALNLY